MSDLAVKGLADLQRFLNQVPAKMEANIMRGGLRAGAKVIEAEAKQNCPVRAGDLKASIRVGTKRKGSTVIATVKAGNKKAWYWRFVEYGTAAHDIKPKNRKSLFLAGIFREIVHHPGAKPRPFMRPALDTKAGAAVQATGEYIKNRLITKQGLDASGVNIEVGQ